ncbi:FlgO family outer membrane protein [Qipengyuania sp. ASV99]|uniref:FlgO family outer membrane protein n=1 Tax=Qipengyuania sp. ASV99 TaxID=3399681 RepID=UPI003A4C75D8
MATSTPDKPVARVKQAQYGPQTMQVGEYSEEAIRRSLENVLASPQFLASPRQCQLLSYLVEETLAGRSDKLKGYGIGIDVFGRDSDFDPSEDSLVRVHMSRLRSLLSDYYTLDGAADDPVIILRPGAYVPKFQAPKKINKTNAAASKFKSREGTDVTPERAIIFALIAFIVAMLFWDHLVPNFNPEQAARQPEGPSVAVAAFQVNGTELVLAEQLRSGLQHEIVSYLSQLPNLAVLGHDTVKDREFESSKDRRAADFVLLGTITVDDTGFLVNSSLLRTSDEEVVWSQRSELTSLSTTNFLTVKSDIALAIAAELGQPYGVIHEAMRNNITLQRDVDLNDYFCELSAYDYMRTKEPVERAEVRSCLNDAIHENPRYSDALALLSFIYGEEGRLIAGRRSQTGADSYPEQSLGFAKRAVEANTTNSMAYSQLALAQYFSGNDATASVSIERALRMSPNNTEILADAAWLYAALGNCQLSDGLSSKAISLNPGHPPWYWLGPALCAITSGDGSKALRFAQLYRQEDSLHARFVLAAALRMNGEDEDADEVIAGAREDFSFSMQELQSNIAVWRLPDKVIALAM